VPVVRVQIARRPARFRVLCRRVASFFPVRLSWMMDSCPVALPAPDDERNPFARLWAHDQPLSATPSDVLALVLLALWAAACFSRWSQCGLRRMVREQSTQVKIVDKKITTYSNRCRRGSRPLTNFGSRGSVTVEDDVEPRCTRVIISAPGAPDRTQRRTRARSAAAMAPPALCARACWRKGR
jgi:hypothetical protein